MESSEFDALLQKHRVIVERYINFRMPSTYDADDVLQETYISAFLHFKELRNIELFKPWILSIAKNQCSLWYRHKYQRETISLESIEDVIEAPRSYYDDTVESVLRMLPHDSVLVLRHTMNGLKQAEIAEELGIPVGTVKSRLHYAKKLFRSVCPPELKLTYERGNKIMKNNNDTHNFPSEMPQIKIEKTDVPFFEVRCYDQAFIVPLVGNKNSEATYRYPDKNLTLVSTCYVPKKAVIHGVEGVQICRDTFNVGANKLYKNENIWFTQLTDEYMRNLGSIHFNDEDDYPTTIYTFLEEDYDIIVNGGDRVHGVPVLLKENPAYEDADGIHIDEYNTNYTMGVCRLTIGSRVFEVVKVINVQMNTVVSESYFDKNNRLVFMRWYESAGSINSNDNYSDTYKSKIGLNTRVIVNGKEFIHIEDRISEYAM